MRYLYAGLVVVAVVLSRWGNAAFAEPQVLKAWNFEQELEGWLTPDPQGKLSVCKEAAHVHNGGGSLQFAYKLRVGAQGEFPGVAFAPVEGQAGLAALHLAVEASVSAPVLVLLREQDESNYVYLCYVPAGKWQVLDLPLADFSLEDESKDENGKLDPEQVVGLGLVDPATWLLQAGQQPGFPFAVSLPAERTLWVDEVQLLSEAPRKLRAAQGPGGAEALMLEDCDGDPSYFGALGGLNLRARSDSDQAVAESSLRLDYDLPAKTVLAVMRPLRRGVLTGYQSIVFSARAGADTRLVVSLEESDKSRYSALVELPASNWQQFTVRLRDLKLDDESVDPDEGLQLDKVRNLQFVDASSIISDKDSANSLWLDEIMAVK